jgi:hypothetical protein
MSLYSTPTYPTIIKKSTLSKLIERFFTGNKESKIGIDNDNDDNDNTNNNNNNNDNNDDDTGIRKASSTFSGVKPKPTMKSRTKTSRMKTPRMKTSRTLVTGGNSRNLRKLKTRKPQKTRKIYKNKK